MQKPRCSLALLTAACFGVSLALVAQTRPIPMTADAWDPNGIPVTFETHLGVPAMRIGAYGPTTADATVTLRDFTFRDGTLEFDHAMEDSSFFSAVHFRRVDEANSEHAYLRTFFAGETHVNEALQYAAILDGVNYWDISPDFQAAVAIDSTGYNHVKLVVKGRQLLMYVNDMTTPALYVPRMDTDIREGKLGFSGRGYYANLTYGPSTESLHGEEGYDPTLGDGRYLRDWQVSAPQSIRKDLALSTLTPPETLDGARDIEAERLGLVNLSRPFGKTAGDDRRVAWLRKTVTATTALEVTVDLGFSDEIAIWVNGRLAYVDENNYGTAQMKYPKGRADLDNAQVRLALDEGDNVITVALANDFFGWGMVARVRETTGLAW